MYTLYQQQGIIGCSLAFIILGFVGHASDKISIRIMLPVSFIIRALVFYSVWTVQDPTSWIFYVLVPLLHLSFYIVVIVSTSYMQKMFPKDIRGMCMSVEGIFSIIGIAIYLIFSQ